MSPGHGFAPLLIAAAGLGVGYFCVLVSSRRQGRSLPLTYPTPADLFDCALGWFVHSDLRKQIDKITARVRDGSIALVENRPKGSGHGGSVGAVLCVKKMCYDLNEAIVFDLRNQAKQCGYRTMITHGAGRARVTAGSAAVRATDPVLIDGVRGLIPPSLQPRPSLPL
jgi:hypothetical protein